MALLGSDIELARGVGSSTVRPGLSVQLRALPFFTEVDADRVHQLRDGREAYPAMLEAIREAAHEVLLEMH